MRKLITAAAQRGPISKSESREDAVKRLLEMMREAKGRGCELVVFTELALTTFFPRWMIEDEDELDSYYETEMPGMTKVIADLKLFCRYNSKSVPCLHTLFQNILP